MQYVETIWQYNPYWIFHADETKIITMNNTEHNDSKRSVNFHLHGYWIEMETWIL